MDEKIYKITLADGTIIDNLTLNGNNFISRTPLDESVFAENCHPVIINDGNSDEVHADMELVQIVHVDEGDYWFVLRDISAEELSKIKLQSDLEYVAMMTGVEL